MSCVVQEEKQKRKEITPLGVITGASRPRGSLSVWIIHLVHAYAGIDQKMWKLALDSIVAHTPGGNVQDQICIQRYIKSCAIIDFCSCKLLLSLPDAHMSVTNNTKS